MKPLNIVRKVKERKLFLLSSINELESFEFSKYVPDEAKKTEISFKKDRQTNGYVLEIDYILQLTINKLEE